MSSHQPPPPAFAHLVNLADDLTGTFILWANDDFFAPKENLLKPGLPEWKEGEYTDKGKWMDGWESQRRREPGHDTCLVRLGTPGAITGILADTTHFKGNAPQEVSLEVLEAEHTATAAQLDARTDWVEVLPRTAVKPDFANALALPKVSPRATHVRFHIYPDGGVARLRVYGEVLPAPRAFWSNAAVDLASLELGGTIAAVSDQFFGPPSNLLLPGRGVNMGDGWETKRRRTPGSDWCVIKLGRRGVVERLELDTHFFKGNAPQAVRVESLDEGTLGAAAVSARLRAPEGWDEWLEKTPLVQHRRHVLEPARPRTVTHLRVHIFPHGGVNRLRCFGTALDTEAEAKALATWHQLSPEEARGHALAFNGSRRWAEGMASALAAGSVREWLAAGQKRWWSLESADWLEAFAAHPKLGETKAAASQTAQSASWSKGEQSGLANAEAQAAERMKALNAQYLEKFGFIFICFATGKSPADVLEQLELRLPNTRAQELENAAREQWRITSLRMEKWLLGR
ncbi:MAG: allantoicase [Myxococcaceae bacterium]|nr:allantoicase [Myxococcaceae bacterium]